MLKAIQAALMLLIISATPASAATYYVATTGLESRTCDEAQMIETPKQTINDAIDCLAAGDTLYVRAGDYDEVLLNPPLVGTPDNAITIAAYPGDGAVWLRPTVPVGMGNYVVILANNQQYAVFDGINMDATNAVGGFRIEGWYDGHASIGYITLQNLEIVGAYQNTHGVIDIAVVAGVLGHNTYRNLKIHRWGTDDNAYGLYLQSSDALVELCDIFDVEGYGIHVYNGFDPGDAPWNITIRKNTIHDIVRRNSSFGTSSLTAIIAYAGARNTLIYDNSIYNNGSEPYSQYTDFGILIGGGASETEIYNNTIYNNIVRAIGVYSATNTTITNNLAWANSDDSLDDSGSSTTQTTNSWQVFPGVDPNFVDESHNPDLHLQSGSLAIVAGTTLDAVPDDIEGTTRTNPYDLGAFKF